MKKEFLIILIFALYLGFTTKKSGADFNVYYSAAKNFVTEKTISYPSVETYKTTDYNYAPVSLLLFVPFACFPRETANALWFWVNIFFIFTGIYLIWKTVDGKKTLLLPVFLLLGVFFYPVRFALMLGQASVMIFFIYTLSYYLIKKDSDYITGFLLSIPVMLKVYPVIFLIFALLVRRKKMFFSMFISIVFWMLLSAAVFGIRVNLDYLKHIWYIWSYAKWDTYPNWISINAFLGRMFGLGTGTRVLSSAAALILFGVSILASLRIKENQIVFFIFVLLSILLSKFLQIHWLVWAVIPVFSLIAQFISEKKLVNLIGIVFLYITMNTSDTSFMVCLFRNYFPKTDLLLHFLPMFGVFLLWLILVLPAIFNQTRFYAFCFFGLFILMSGSLFARQGIVILKNGNKISGDILCNEEGEYILEKNKCAVLFQKKEVKTVKYTENQKEENIDGNFIQKMKNTKKQESRTQKPKNYNYDPLIHVYAEKYNLDPAFVKAVIESESNFNQQDISCKGAIGLMQLMPGTAAELKVDPKDAEGNIEGGIKYLNSLFKKFGDSKLALAGYNAGPGAVKKYGEKIPPYKETQNYVGKVLKNYEKYKSDKQMWYFVDESGCLHFSDRPADKRYRRINK